MSKSKKITNVSDGWLWWVFLAAIWCNEMKIYPFSARNSREKKTGPFVTPKETLLPENRPVSGGAPEPPVPAGGPSTIAASSLLKYNPPGGGVRDPKAVRHFQKTDLSAPEEGDI